MKTSMHCKKKLPSLFVPGRNVVSIHPIFSLLHLSDSFPFLFYYFVFPFTLISLLFIDPSFAHVFPFLSMSMPPFLDNNNNNKKMARSSPSASVFPPRFPIFLSLSSLFHCNTCLLAAFPLPIHPSLFTVACFHTFSPNYPHY